MKSLFSFSVVLISAIVSSGVALGETIYFVAPHAPEPIQAIDTNNLGKFAASKSGPHDVYNNGTKGSITWTVTYSDVDLSNGIGFDDATEGATRRATVLAVLAYIDDELNSSTPATIDISFDTSLTTGTGFLAFAGTFFTGASAIEVGYAGSHIQTGVDPSGASPDIFSTFNFGYSWQADHTVAPSGGEFDLFTVLIHEFTHGLGFIGSVDSAGVGQLSGTVTAWDSFMERDDAGAIGSGSTTDLFDASPAFVGVAGDLISDRLVMTAPTATAALGLNPRVYSPSPFASGSSLGHWDTPTYPTSIMKHSVSPGTEINAYLPFEVGMLVDLGYSSAGTTVPTLNFVSSNFGVYETDGSKTIGVSLSTPSTIGSVSVTYATSVGGGNPATPGDDYTATGGTLTWLMGESGIKTFSVPVASNAPVENTETVILTLSAPTGDGVLGTTTSATLNIIDPANLPLSPYVLLSILLALGAAGFVVRKRVRNS